MEYNKENIFKKSTDKLLIKFAVPAIISLLVAELYNMVDTIYVGRAIGGIGIGALTIAFPVQRLMAAIGMMVAIGAYTAVARNLGEKNTKEIKLVIINSIGVTIFIIAALTFLILIFEDSIIRNLGASEAIFQYAKDYISIVVLGGIFQCLSFVLCYIMTALGNTKVTLKVTSLGAIFNILIDYILVISYPMGVKGAALATVISQIIAFIYAGYLFKNIIKDMKIYREFKLRVDIIGKIIGVGFSTFVIEISDALVAIILNNLLRAYGGDEAIIILGVTTKISMFLFITIIGISSAMQPIAAYNYGACNYEKVREVLLKTIKLVMISSILAWAFMIIFPQSIIGFFLRDSELLLKTVNRFRIVIGVFPVVSIYYVAIYYYQAMGNGKESFLLSIYRQIIIFIPLLILMVKIFGLKGVWISYPVSDILSALTGVIYIKKCHTADKNQILQAASY